MIYNIRDVAAAMFGMATTMPPRTIKPRKPRKRMRRESDRRLAAMVDENAVESGHLRAKIAAQTAEISGQRAEISALREQIRELPKQIGGQPSHLEAAIRDINNGAAGDPA